MSTIDVHKRRVGAALLEFSAWIRRQSWLRAIYRHFPIGLRMAVSKTLASPLHRSVKFARTARWTLPEREVVESWPQERAATKFGEAAGINVFAHIRGQFGLAESARLYTRALLGEGYPVAVRDIELNLAHSMGDSSLSAHIGGSVLHDVNLIFINPDYLEEACEVIGEDRLAGRYTIGCWFWELENFPSEWLPALDRVDEIMVASEFVAELVGRVTDKPVLHVPLPLLDVSDSGLTRADFGLREKAYVFLTSFDFNSFLARKNPFAAIEAFRRAFPDERHDVQLLVKSSNGHRHPERFGELLEAVGKDARILVRDEVIEREHVQALQRCADAYVSLHRAEGFGLGLAECMRMGKPVIATGWSGNMEFMTPQNSCLVDYDLIAVLEGEYMHHEGQRWAEPSVEHAAGHMKRLVEDQAYAAGIGAQAAQDVRAKLAPQTSALRIIRRLEALVSASTVSGHPGSIPATDITPR